MASIDEIQAVRAVLYDPSRSRQIADHLARIDTLLPFGGKGPRFYDRHGRVSTAARSAASRADAIAGLLRASSAELGQVSFAAADRLHLQAALDEQAGAWAARATAWRAPGKPDARRTAGRVGDHERAAARNLRHVEHYLDPAYRG